MAATDNYQPRWHRVCLNTIVRKDMNLDSERLRILPMGSKVYVTEQVERRVKITKPILGWCSLKSSNGDTILTPLDDDNSDAPETPSSNRVDLRQKAEQATQKYQNKTKHLTEAVQAADFSASQKEDMNKLISAGDLDELRAKIEAVQSQIAEKSSAQARVLKELSRETEEAARAKAMCSALEKTADLKMKELQQVQAEMKELIASDNGPEVEPAGQTRPLEPGAVVLCTAQGVPFIGMVRFIGNVEGQEGTFLGLEVEGGGDTNGTYNDKTYFTVSDYSKGLFVPIGNVTNRLYPDQLLIKLFIQMQRKAMEDTKTE